MAGNKILIVEDDRTLLEGLKYSLTREGYRVSTATDGVQALELAREEKPDLIILDIMLPELDGLEVCRILRKEGMAIPILMLTAKVEEIDRVVGLELGADDYITKPFSLRELLARIRASLRRVEMTQWEVSQQAPPRLRFGDLEIDLPRHQVTLGDSVLSLSRKEFELLAFLAKNRGLVISRDTLLEKIWGYEYEGDTRTVDVHIRWLREKIESDSANPRRILTVRGVGYKFEG
ncbi:MAG: response regulator transcription factor [Dehalococcoidia bacterium]|jgi:DNA-binding response OmpR family regulator|nr:response regulator transcription factor [Chloroflexota bacterium]MCK4243128.1 response regulator transcription factor [Dehalococcoidia bacterium]